MDAHVLDAGEARMPRLTGMASIPSSGLGRCSASSSIRIIPPRCLPAETNAPSYIGIIGACSLATGSCPSNDYFREDIADTTVLVRRLSLDVSLPSVGMTVRMIAVVVVVIVTVGVAMAMPSEDEEADEVGEQSGRSNNQHEFGVIDLGWLDESGQRFEDDGNAKRDKEDGIEEGSEDLGSNPL